MEGSVRFREQNVNGPVASPVNDIWDFIDAIFPQDLLPAAERICVSKAFIGRDSQTGFVNVDADRNPEFERWADKHGRARGSWYVYSGTVDGETNEKGRLSRKLTNTVRVYAVVLDDIGTKSKEPPVEPSWTMETSEGNYQWGYLIAGGTRELDRVARLVDWCADNGWTDEGAKGAARAVRLPHSFNLKESAEGWKSKLEWRGGAWTLDELEKALGVPANYVGGTKQAAPKPSGADAVGDIDEVLNWLAGQGEVLRDDGGEWVEVVCPNHAQHTDGRVGAYYSPLGRGSGDWVYNRGFKCHHAHCTAIKGEDYLDGIAKRGGPTAPEWDALTVMQERYVLVQEGKQVADLHSRRSGTQDISKKDDFAFAHGVRTGKDNGTRFSQWVSHSDTKRVRATINKPTLEDEPFTVDETGREVLNLYVPPTWPETDEEPTMVLEHIRYLLPDENECRFFLAWLAFKIQNPASRTVATLMVSGDGVQGIGRSWLGQMLQKMLTGRVRKISLPQMLGQGQRGSGNFNDWNDGGAQFVLIDEVKTGGEGRTSTFYTGYETFKELVDPAVTYCDVNKKYGELKTGVPQYWSLLMFSNHSNPICIPEEDRRVAVLQNPSEPKSEDYWAKRWAELNDPNGQEHIRLYWWLRRASVEDLLPDGWRLDTAPDTPARRTMIEEGQSSDDQLIAAFHDDDKGSEFYTQKTLRRRLEALAVELGLPTHEADAAAARVLSRCWSRLHDKPGSDPTKGYRIEVGTGRSRLRARSRDADWEAGPATWREAQQIGLGLVR